MATNEPMTTERIYEIDALWVFLDETEVDEARDALRELLIEVRRLRAREQALAAEIAAMRPMVEAVANDEMAVYWNRDVHRFCCHRCDAPPTLHMCQIAHTPNCRYEQARAFVATHPTAGEGEAERERRGWRRTNR